MARNRNVGKTLIVVCLGLKSKEKGEEREEKLKTFRSPLPLPLPSPHRHHLSTSLSPSSSASNDGVCASDEEAERVMAAGAAFGLACICVLFGPAFGGDPFAFFDWDVSYISASPLGAPQQVPCFFSSSFF